MLSFSTNKDVQNVCIFAKFCLASKEPPKNPCVLSSRFDLNEGMKELKKQTSWQATI